MEMTLSYSTRRGGGARPARRAEGHPGPGLAAAATLAAPAGLGLFAGAGPGVGTGARAHADLVLRGVDLPGSSSMD